MPKIKVEIRLTPDEFRKMLPDELKELYDDLCQKLTEISALSPEEAKIIIANEMLKSLRGELNAIG